MKRRSFITGLVAAPFVFRTSLVRAQGGRTRLTAPLVLPVGPGQPYGQPQDAINDLMTVYDFAGFGVGISLAGGTSTLAPALYNPFTVSGRGVGQNNGSLISIFGPDPSTPGKVVVIGQDTDAVTVTDTAHVALFNMQAQTYSRVGSQNGKGFVCDGPGSHMHLSNCSAGNVNGAAFANVNGGFTQAIGSRVNSGPSTNVISMLGSPGLSVLANLNDGSKFEFESVDVNLLAGQGAGYSDNNGFHIGYFAIAAQGYLHMVDTRIPNKSFNAMQLRFYQAAVFSNGGDGTGAGNVSEGYFPGTGYQLIEQSLYNGSPT